LATLSERPELRSLLLRPEELSERELRDLEVEPIETLLEA
jgi:hypothetical protein